MTNDLSKRVLLAFTIGAIVIARVYLYAFFWPGNELDFGDLHSRIDFNHYYAAGSLFADSPERLYCASFPKDSVAQVQADSDISQVTNPPPLAMLLAPLSHLSPRVAWITWSAMMLACAIASVILSSSLWGVSWSKRDRLLAAILFIFSFPMLSHFKYGQVQLLLLMLVLLGWYMRGRNLHSWAVLWGVAIGMKLFLWPLAVLLFSFRKWRDCAYLALGVCITVCLPVLFAGHDIWWEFIRCALPIIDDWSHYGASVSFEGFFYGVCSCFGFNAAADRQLIRVIISLLIIMCVLSIGFYSISRWQEDRAFAVVLFLATVFAPVTWPHYFVLCLPLFYTRWNYSGRSFRLAAILLLIWSLLPYATLRLDGVSNLSCLTWSIRLMIPSFALLAVSLWPWNGSGGDGGDGETVVSALEQK